MDSISLLGPPNQPKVLNQEDFDIRFNFVRHRKRRTNREVLRRFIVENFRDYPDFSGLIPFLAWIKSYDVKTNGFRDFAGSLLIAALLIPQGLANGLLVSDVFSGIFSVLLPHLIYPILGSGRHCSLGTFSLTSFLIYTSVKYTGSSISTITFCCGIFQLLHFLLPLEFLLSFASSNLLIGFNVGASIRIVWHFIPSIFKFSGDDCEEIINNLNLTCLECVGSAISCVQSLNISSSVIFIVLLIILLVFKWKLNATFTDRIGTTIPHELISMLIIAVLSYFLEIPKSDLLGKSLDSRAFIFSPPSLSSAQMLLDSFAVFLYSFSCHIRMVCSAEKSYKVIVKQESLCFSLISLISSPFGLLPPLNAKENSQSCNETKKFSLLSNLLSTIWLTPLLYFGQLSVLRLIPESAVAALVIASVFDLFIDLRYLRVLYSSHIFDAIIATLGLLSTLFIPNLCVAFLVSVACALISIALRTQRPQCDVIVRVSDNYFAEEKRYEGECPDTPLRVLRVSSPLVFINCNAVRKAIEAQAVAVKKLIGVGASRSPSVRSHAIAYRRESLAARSNTNLTNIIITQDTDISQVPPPDSTVLRFIILDCTGMAYVDPEALAMLSQIYSDLRADNIKLLFSGVNSNVRDILEISMFYSCIPRGHFFPTLHDALMAVRIMNSPFHTSVSMNGYRDVIALSTTPSHQDLLYRLSPEPV